MIIVEIQFEPNGETARYLAPDVLASIGARFEVPGGKMGTVVETHGAPSHGEKLPEVGRPLAPGEVWHA